MFRKFLQEWYVLNKTQRRGALFSLILLFIVFILKLFYTPPVDRDVIHFANIILTNTADSFNEKKSFKHDSLFFFDPNVVSETDMKLLGLSDKTIRQISNYRKAGGKFYSKESLKKIYSINDSIYQKLEPYILIPSVSQSTTSLKYSTSFQSKNNSPRFLKAIELNAADSTELEKLNGIGKVLSVRIFKYRNRLGGFYSIEQLKEVYGIKDSLFNIITQKNKISIDTTLIRKIHIKTADFKEMIRHPYFTKDFIQKILQARKKGENITKEKIQSWLSEGVYEKVINYTALD
ncbi:MAG: helix-hairpin-helix domain-containing protein [Bacteroidia bacterium]|nr:helix-hairpin-helix domain-containing protein [Bacteroidia bacterium]